MKYNILEIREDKDGDLYFLIENYEHGVNGWVTLSHDQWWPENLPQQRPGTFTDEKHITLPARARAAGLKAEYRRLDKQREEESQKKPPAPEDHRGEVSQSFIEALIAKSGDEMIRMRRWEYNGLSDPYWQPGNRLWPEGIPTNIYVFHRSENNYNLSLQDEWIHFRLLPKPPWMK